MGTTPKLTNATVFAANESSRNAAALNVVACVQGRVIIVANLPGRFTGVKSAVKRFDLSRPELKVTCSILTITREGNLWGSTRKHVQDFAVYRNWWG